MLSRMLMLSVLTLLAVGCSNKLSGDFKVESKAGNASFAPDACMSGERKNFYGVDLYVEDDTTQGLRLAEDVGGYVVLFDVPGQDKRFILDSSSNATCKTWDIKLEEQSSSVNEVTNVMGHVKIDCDLHGIGRVSSNVSFENCH